MKDILLVGLGGFIGSVARFKIGGLVLHLTAQERFPYSTFAVNLLGCLLIGILAGLAERYELFGPSTRLFLFTGLLGGFTTFSAFGLDKYLCKRYMVFFPKVSEYKYKGLFKRAVRLISVQREPVVFDKGP